MAPFSIKDVLAAFNPAGAYLAISAGDGRVKIWDAVSGSMQGEFMDLGTSTSGASPVVGGIHGHLAMDYTYMTWNASARKVKKKSGKHGVSSLLAFGTGTGDVLAWDSVLGQLKWRTKDCHPGGVRSLAFASSGSLLYSAGADGMVCELDATSGELTGKFRASKRAVSCIAVSSDGGKMAAGSSELRLFDLSSKKRIRKFMGHPDVVKALIFTEDANYILSSAIGDRHVAMWCTDESRSESAAACVLSMEHPAVSLDCSGGVAEGKTLRVLALSDAGVAYIWYASSLEDLAKMNPVKISVACSNLGKSGKTTKPGVLAARLFGKAEDGPGSVLVAYGTTVKPVFERLSLKDQNEIILHTDQNGVLLHVPPTYGLGDTKIWQEEAIVLGPDNAADAAQPKPHVEFGEVSTLKKTLSKKKRKASVDLVEQAQPLIEDRLKISGICRNEPDGATGLSVDDDEEETMEDKLRALGVIENEGNEDMISGKDGMVPPRADSLQVLLTQALQADDNSLLEQCLAVSDEKVIANTIRRLRSSDAAKFLQVSVFKMEARPKSAWMLVPWIRAILLHHAAYIMSNSSMQSVLSSLYQVVDARLSMFRPLLALSGRLDLILAQLSYNDAERGADVADAAVVYEEESEDNLQDEVEDVMEDDMEVSDSDVELNSGEDHMDMNTKGGVFNVTGSDASEDDL